MTMSPSHQAGRISWNAASSYNMPLSWEERAAFFSVAGLTPCDRQPDDFLVDLRWDPSMLDDVGKGLQIDASDRKDNL